MNVVTTSFDTDTIAECEMFDITEKVQSLVTSNNIKTGTVSIFVQGSTAGITTIEFEPGLGKDFPLFLERIVPKALKYHHHDTWGDHNGHGHVRASLLKPDLVVPINHGTLVCGTWQQIVCINLDDHSRARRIFVTIMGK